MTLPIFIYTNGTSEEYLGDFLQGQRDQFVLATKYTIMMHPSDPNAQGNQRKNLRGSLEASLKRLKTDYIDLYWVHMWDGITSAEEIAHSMNDAVRAGKILYYGLSDFPAWLIAKIDTYAAAHNMERPAAVQLEYNLAQRESERELIPFAENAGLSVLAWSPLGGGVLTGKYLVEPEHAEPEGRVASGAVSHFDRYKEDAAIRVAQAVSDVAHTVGCSPAQLAIAWLRHHSPLNIPIVGARKLTHLEDNLKAAELELSADIMQRLDEASAIHLGFPTEFFRNGWPYWYGPVPERFDRRVHLSARKLFGWDAQDPGLKTRHPLLNKTTEVA
ncbi:aldo/keto reductase [Vacuolonema iberomarrocanum]|uniref:aldo/keto reductase n=1 Tax=Vacuolonema iberomarrocanum TaxID=3454632 RepID=UPI003F6DF61B